MKLTSGKSRRRRHASGDAYRLPAPNPLWAQMVLIRSSRALSMNACPTWGQAGAVVEPPGVARRLKASGKWVNILPRGDRVPRAFAYLPRLARSGRSSAAPGRGAGRSPSRSKLAVWRSPP
jgi:hypothetical protein